MTTFIYTATDSVQSHHALGQTYQVEFDTQSAPPKRSIMREVQRSLSGKQETIKHYGEKSWSIKFAPIPGHRLPELEELLDSIEDGQTLSVYLFGNEPAPRSMICAYNGYNLEEFMMLGDEQSDWWVTSIELRQV